MSNKLFTAVKEGHDPKNRPVFICKDESGFYVYKPQTGFKSKSFEKNDDPVLNASFERQVLCSQNNAFYLQEEIAVEGNEVKKN